MSDDLTDLKQLRDEYQGDYRKYGSAPGYVETWSRLYKPGDRVLYGIIPSVVYAVDRAVLTIHTISGTVRHIDWDDRDCITPAVKDVQQGTFEPEEKTGTRATPLKSLLAVGDEVYVDQAETHGTILGAEWVPMYHVALHSGPEITVCDTPETKVYGVDEAEQAPPAYPLS